jgi:cytidylate kinase
MGRHRVIAIDGPAASGKSSVARELARRLDFVYVNSGAMYRAMTWHILQHGVSPNDAARVAKLAETARIVCDLRNNEGHVLIDDVDPTEHLCDDQVNQAVSLVSSVPRVRKIIVGKLRNYSRDYDVVMEGRDIG